MRPPTAAALFDSKFFDGECCQLFWVTHAALAHLYNLLCDDVGNGIVAVNEAEPVYGRRGDADVVFVHAKPMEVGFIAEGYGVKRYPVMYNDFVLIGPKSDPAGIRGTRYAEDALQMIKEKQSLFISRGDRSDTNLTELMLWNRDAGINIEKEKGRVVHTYRTGHERCAQDGRRDGGLCSLWSQHLAWISFRNRGDLEILVQGDKHLFNQYSVILVNPAKYPNVKEGLGREFVDWLVSPDGQQTIANYKINGEQLFFPNATDSNAW
jgi:tungstate transport system substrate-binding protein